jgi:hypothetical protein
MDDFIEHVMLRPPRYLGRGGPGSPQLELKIAVPVRLSQFKRHERPETLGPRY